MDFIGRVVDISDKYGSDRIKVALEPYDKYKDFTEIPEAIPWLPRFIHVKPKVGEACRVICEDDDPDKQRYYVGSIISQPQTMYKENFNFSNTTSMWSPITPLTSVNDIPKAKGAYADDDEIAIYGRKNSDIILSDNDVRVRCGARVASLYDTTDVAFNRTSPSFLKLSYHEGCLNVTKKIVDEEKNENVSSVATLVADEINLISNCGDPYINTANQDEKSISDEDMKKIIEKAHLLPYGDVLVEFLNIFVDAFISHTHPYPLAQPIPDSTYMKLLNFDQKEILSKHVRIN